MASEKKEKDEKKGGFKKFIVVILALAVLGAGSFFGMKMYMENKDQAKDKPVKESYYEIGEFMVKLSDEGGKRFLKAKVAITYDSNNEDLVEELDEKKIGVRDTANFYFMSKKVSDFEPQNELAIKKGLVEKINGLLTNGRVIDVKFSELITQ